MLYSRHRCHGSTSGSKGPLPHRRYDAAHCAAVQPASSHDATTAATVAAGHPRVNTHLSYVPRQSQIALGLRGLDMMHVVSAEPHSFRLPASQSPSGGGVVNDELDGCQGGMRQNATVG